MRARHERISVLLRRIAEEGEPTDSISFAMLAERMGDRGFGVILFIWALPNMIPLPGISSLFGMLIAVTGGQMVLGHRRPWLPKALLGRSVRRADFARMVDRAQPYLERFERFCKPRLTVVPQGLAERLVGLLLVILGFVLLLPLVGANLLPAIGVAILSLGLIETDGVMVLAGVAASAIALAVFALIVGTGFYAVTHFLDQVPAW
ncbi:MAG: exopolysaccharide biosynthesis protein [Alphaproteobacteria bacterium]